MIVSAVASVAVSTVRCENEGLRESVAAVESAKSDDLAPIIDAACTLKNPSRFARDQVVQVFHDAIGVKESMLETRLRIIG